MVAFSETPLKQKKQSPRLLDRYPIRAISIGFSLVVLLMLALVVFGLSRFSAIRAALDDVAEKHNHHAALAYTMYNASRERAFLLYNITSDPDPFSRDEKIQLFYSLGAEFSEARIKLLASNLTPAEKAVLDTQGKYTAVTMNLQQEVIDLVATERMKEASSLLQEKAIPAQARAFEVINGFFLSQVKGTRDKVTAVARLQEGAGAFMFAGGSAAIALATLIALFVSRRMKEAERVLRRGKEELENLVSERTTELREREELLGLITSSAHDAIVMVDDSGALTYWNEAADKIFGYTREEAMGRNFLALIVPPQSRYRKQYETGLKQLAAAESGNAGEAVEMGAVRKDDSECLVELSLSAVQIRGRRHGIGIARDITDRKRAEEKLKLQATTDALTGIANRRLFNTFLETEMSRATRHHLPLAVMLVDVDHFKRINDAFGHQAGDDVLVELARLVSGKIRAHDLFARWGGEEFVILSPHCDAEKVRLLAEKLRTAVEMHVFPGIGHVTCSFGVTEYGAGDSVENFIGRADAGLYRAKENGRNRVEMA
jgi:diguanylate cyclase (GGDEF)-like protein/PAS domain S-box-containing protein